MKSSIVATGKIGNRSLRVVHNPSTAFDQKANGPTGKMDSTTSVTVLEDETNLSGEDVTPIFRDGLGAAFISEENSFQFFGVRFIPKMIEFTEAFEGKQYAQKITLQNVGKNPVLVKVGEPSSFVSNKKKFEK